MGWSPKVGEVLPRAAEAFGIEEKLIGYSLDIASIDAVRDNAPYGVNDKEAAPRLVSAYVKP